MSGGGSSGDAGSDSQEATAPQDYETNYSEYQGGPAYDFDDTTTGATSTTSTTSSSNDNVPDAVGGNNNTTTTTTDSNGDDIDSQYTTGKEFNVTPSKLSVIDYAKDEYRKQNLFKKGLTTKGLLNINTLEPVTTTIGLLYSGYKAKKAAEKPPEPNLPTGEDGYGEGDYKSTVGDWAESRGLTKDYSSEDLETQRNIDQQAFDAGFRTQDATTMNINNNDNDSPDTTIGDNTYASASSPFRIVNTQGTGLPDPSNFLFNYVGSKQNILDLYDNAKNVLYTPQTNNGLLAVSDSPYYDFLKTRNLNRRIL
tara:strand:+ start:3105 stop:4034 length:930 start_codon:yes stop_codon:yes gene_type:complete